MGRPLAVAIFALAAGSAALASAGVAVPAHRMSVGTPLDHSMPLAAYRLSFLIEPAERAAGTELTPAMAALHQALAGMSLTMEMPAQTTDTEAGPLFRTSASGPLDLGIALALLVALVPRLPRPTSRLIAVLPRPAREATQWSPAVPLVPPRGIALSGARA